MYRFLFEHSEQVVIYISAWLSSNRERPTYTVVPYLHLFSLDQQLSLVQGQQVCWSLSRGQHAGGKNTPVSHRAHTLAHIPYILSPIGSVIYAALWEETEDPRENPCRRGEDM